MNVYTILFCLIGDSMHVHVQYVYTIIGTPTCTCMYVHVTVVHTSCHVTFMNTPR